jgi:4-hydroxythreonine-4-phosphate dehydrogenase
MSTRNPKIVITSGEPAGIGPDICLSLASLDVKKFQQAELYIIADPALMTERASELGQAIELSIHHHLDQLSDYYQAGKLNIIPVKLHSTTQAGILDKANSHYVLEMLNIACDLCLHKKVDAMVTGPVQKSVINDAGIAFTGHTEYLAEIASTDVAIHPVMMLATERLRVALATTHLPLQAVSRAITAESLTATLTTLNDFLKEHAAIPEPTILVCGLNPHAGEGGNLGEEEIRVIIPVIEKLKKQNMKLVGPLPADTLFTPKYLDHADAVLAMYHDQGLPVLKYSGFGKAVNITLGLPFIRTSVDHGTALDLAATGKASNSSLLEAIAMAITLSHPH